MLDREATISTSLCGTSIAAPQRLAGVLGGVFSTLVGCILYADRLQLLIGAVLGWQNSATYSSVITYNVYWIVVIGWLMVMRFQETHERYPLMKAKTATVGSRAASEEPVEEARQKHAAGPDVAEVKE